MFEHGGPYTDLYDVKPWEAKKDSRLRESGKVIGFNLFGKDFKSEPKDFFYNWIYINLQLKIFPEKKSLKRDYIYLE